MFSKKSIKSEIFHQICTAVLITAQNAGKFVLITSNNGECVSSSTDGNQNET